MRAAHCCCQHAGIGAGRGHADTGGVATVLSPVLSPATTAPCPAAIQAYDHVGIRVSDRRRAVAFYEALGFVEQQRFPALEANEMCTASDVRINLIFNGARQRGAHNRLLDDPVKLPGFTHPAFVVDDLAALQGWLHTQGIPITEGPKRIGPRRIALFIRDPDGNVLEFNQLCPATDAAAAAVGIDTPIPAPNRRGDPDEAV